MLTLTNSNILQRMQVIKGNKIGDNGTKGIKFPNDPDKVPCITTDYGRQVNSYGLPFIMEYIYFEQS